MIWCHRRATPARATKPPTTPTLYGSNAPPRRWRALRTSPNGRPHPAGTSGWCCRHCRPLGAGLQAPASQAPELAVWARTLGACLRWARLARLAATLAARSSRGISVVSFMVDGAPGRLAACGSPARPSVRSLKPA